MPKTEISSEKSSKTWAVPPAICYRLSDKVFMEKGWTFLSDVTPTGKIVTMEAKFSHREISPWFKEREEKFIKRYKNGKVLCQANPDGSGAIFYPNGKLGIEIKKRGKNKETTQISVNSPGGLCEDGIRRPAKLSAVFDSLGNGVIYNHKGEKRMVYDQNHGVLWDAPNGVPIYWNWHHLQYSGSLTTLYSVEESLLDEDSHYSCREIGENKLEKKPSEKEKTLKPTSNSESIISLSPITSQETTTRFSDSRFVNTSKLHPPQGAFFKPMTVKINKYVSLTIFDQANIVLKFFAESHQTRLEIGILYDPQNKHSVKKIEQTLIEPEKVLCNYEVLPATTKSMQKLKNVIKKIKKVTG